MKVTMMKTLVFGLFCTVLASCGRGSDRTEGTTSGDALFEDDTVAAGAIGQVSEESMASLSEESSAGSASLTSADQLGLADTITRSCAESGDNAIVSVEGTISRTANPENAIFSFERTVSGSASMTRTWSRDDGVVECMANGKFASIDWSDIEGLNLHITFERSRSVATEITRKRTGAKKTRSMEFLATGERDIEWLAASVGTDGATTFMRKKQITSSVHRTASFTNVNNVERDFDLTIETKENSPLVVEVTRNLSSKELVSKLIESGTIVAINEDKSSIESAFANVLVTYASGECTVTSGAIVSSFYKAGETDATQVLTATFSNGVAAVVDEDGVEVAEGFEIDGCGDGEDFSN